MLPKSMTITACIFYAQLMMNEISFLTSKAKKKKNSEAYCGLDYIVKMALACYYLLFSTSWKLKCKDCH